MQGEYNVANMSVCSALPVVVLCGTNRLFLCRADDKDTVAVAVLYNHKQLMNDLCLIECHQQCLQPA